MNSMSVDELKRNAVELAMRYKGINDWIKANSDTDPNFYEMTDCLVEYGRLTAQWDKFFEENGYPVMKFEDGKEGKATHYHIPDIVPEVKAARNQLNEMWYARRDHAFFKDETARDFWTELMYRAHIAEYREPENRAVAVSKKNALCKAAGVYLYIWQEKQKNPNFQYDNMSEWEQLKDMYALYSESVGIQEDHIDGDESYSGPQFGRVLEQMMAEIEKNYAFREEKEDIAEDTVGSHK